MYGVWCRVQGYVDAEGLVPVRQLSQLEGEQPARRVDQGERAGREQRGPIHGRHAHVQRLAQGLVLSVQCLGFQGFCFGDATPGVEVRG